MCVIAVYAHQGTSSFFLTCVIWVAAAAAVAQMLGGGFNFKTQNVFVYCGQLNALDSEAFSCTTFFGYFPKHSEGRGDDNHCILHRLSRVSWKWPLLSI
ncbi:hypothetical protein F5146DRAFT_232075 [Armillaria mellea]|nr:hypothetical protein F5146DRAFT_232075 [Armillaria mellea]